MGKSKYALLIFLGACSYGFLTSIVKLAMDAGYTVQEITGSQYLFAFLALLLLVPFIQRTTITMKQFFQLLLTGGFLSLTGILYGLSLHKNDASISVVLLFQFTWIGILFEIFLEKKRPSFEKLVAIVFLLIGTIFAGKLTTDGIGSLALDGVIYGFLSAVTYALFIYFTGKVAPAVPGLQRSTFLTLGGLLLVLISSSGEFLVSGVLWDGLWKYALLTGFFAVLPIICFAFGSPKLDPGLATIVGSAELPASVIAAMVILKEVINLEQSIGIILILIGIIVSQVPLRHVGTNYFRTKQTLNR